MTQTNSRTSKRWLTALVIVLLIAGCNLAAWAYFHRPVYVPDWQGDIHGFAFSAFQRHQSPLLNSFPSEDDLSHDIALLSKYTKRLRTYASSEASAIPRLAEAQGMSVTAGAWLDRRLENNDVEVQSLIGLSRAYNNIDLAIVGNESILRSDLSVDQLITYLDRARKALDIPISTAEPWHVWLKYPELAQHVDYIVIHLLPYWEGLTRKESLDNVLSNYRKIQQAFPNKKIVVGEIGWPSNGDRFKYAQPTVADEAAFLRRWFSIAQREKIEYYVMEAFDQPWKEAGEGRVGAYWGMFGADRNLKFALTGPVQEDPQWLLKAALSIVLALIPMLWFSIRFDRFYTTGKIFFCALIQAACSLLIWSIGVPFDFYLDPFDWTMLAVLLPAQLAILSILLCNGFEFTEALWTPKWRRFAGLRSEPERDEWPWVSIHLACHNEPPEMVIATLDSLANLDYENFEVLVIDNNTEKEEIWKPVEAHCKALGSRFRFFHLRPWPGFKAGALNYGLEQTDPRAEVIAVVDADYVVRNDWLRALVGYFDDPKVAIVQCPQAHRDFENNTFRRMTNWEYEGFFRIGMHHRNERNAIIQHGTMTMIRKAPLVATGQWAQWCIVEDAELGLRMFNAGFEAQYVDVQMGKGLTPADFTAYKSQRFRWAFGAMQILRQHWDWLIKPGHLSTGQRFHFLTGWFSWFADALHLIFTLLAIAWSLGMLYNPDFFSLPLKLFLIPVLGFFVCKALFGILLYRYRVPCSWPDTLGAAVASMGLSHAIARGVLKGLVQKEHPFTRTAKSRRLRKRPTAFSAVHEETLMFVALMLLIVGLVQHIGTQWLEGNLWVSILAAQSLPYAAAILCALISAYSGERSGAFEQEKKITLAPPAPETKSTELSNPT
jgi:exo-beta-1,3-glucanase (GH17 family)/glycosyltransferase involved in cell wall biosynthesis